MTGSAETVREQLHRVLCEGPATARDLSHRLGIPEGDVAGHLEHVARRRAEDEIDPAVGLSALAGRGEEVGPERPLALVHARDHEAARAAAEALKAAMTVAPDADAPAPPVRERLA